MSQTQTPAKVIIVGAGIAGPVLSMFLKLQGYEPVIYERVDSIADAGLSLWYAGSNFPMWIKSKTLTALHCSLQVNGLQVLQKLPGLLDSLVGRPIDAFAFYSALPADPGVLALSGLPVTIREHYGVGMLGVRRAAFHQSLVDAARKNGIPVHFGRQVVALEQGPDSVTVEFADGTKDTASFVVGCDGLHSNTRISLFGKEAAQFTGLVQVRIVNALVALVN